MPHRISDQQLAAIDLALTDRDKQILAIIREAKYLLTGQLQRLFSLSSRGYTTRLLRKLKDYGLINALPPKHVAERTECIWYLTEAGERLFNLGKEKPRVRKVVERNTFTYLRHIIAVAEVYVQVIELTRKDPEITLARHQFEPTCWRFYNHHDKDITLKPDLMLVTNLDDFEDKWFIEMDLNTEDIHVIMEKCKRYHQYYATGIEHKKHGIFPMVVWIVPNARRRKLIEENIRSTFMDKQKIFIVITPDELQDLFMQHLGRDRLC